MYVHVHVCTHLRSVLGIENVHNIAELASGPPDWSGAVDKFQVPLVSEAYFLDGCRIFLTGFSEPQLEKLHRIINLGGGARYVCTYVRTCTATEPALP